MASLTLRRKLEILSDAAKYDASCASSGGAKRSSKDGRGIGSTDSGMGVCHAFTPDGRCVSLLKILLTNFCVYDCVYCVNRVSSNVARARFSVEEVVRLTLDFYKRNYIEGLFLSSGVIKSADFTQEEMNRVAKTLREVHDFRGYIHLKLVAGCSPGLAAEAGLYADRLSVNIERRHASPPRAREEGGGHQARHGHGAARHRGRQPDQSHRPQRREIRARRPEHPDDRGRR